MTDACLGGSGGGSLHLLEDDADDGKTLLMAAVDLDDLKFLQNDCDGVLVFFGNCEFVLAAYFLAVLLDFAALNLFRSSTSAGSNTDCLGGRGGGTWLSSDVDKCPLAIS